MVADKLRTLHAMTAEMPLRTLGIGAAVLGLSYGTSHLAGSILEQSTGYNPVSVDSWRQVGAALAAPSYLRPPDIASTAAIGAGMTIGAVAALTAGGVVGRKMAAARAARLGLPTEGAGLFGSKKGVRDTIREFTAERRKAILRRGADGKLVTPPSIGNGIQRVGKSITDRMFRAVTSAGGRGAVLGMGAVAAGLGILGRGVDRLAQQILGHNQRAFASTSMLAQPQSRRYVGAPTPSRIMRRAGDYSGVGMTGNTVLALHKTGGRGGVLR